MADGGHLEVWENVNNSGLDLCTKVGGQMHHGHAENDDTDQKSKPEVNSRDVIKQMS